MQYCKKTKKNYAIYKAKASQYTQYTNRLPEPLEINEICDKLSLNI